MRLKQFSEMLEEIDDQMMIETVEDFEVSFYNANTMHLEKNVSLTSVCFITENRSGEGKGHARSG